MRDLAAKLTRGEFIKGLLGFFAAAWAALTAYPVFRYLASGSKLQKDEVAVTSVSLGAIDQFPSGTAKNFKFGSKPGILVRTDDGALHAYSAICTHLGCTVQYGEEKKNIWCACHGGQFDAATGRNVAGPPPKPLNPLKADVVNGEIIVSRA